jgi:hypothetical protein
MKGDFLLNDHDVAYLIHGQSLRLEYQTEGCWFVVIAYDNGNSFLQRFFFRKPNSKTFFRPRYFKKANGKFESVTNVYCREITMWGVGWGIKKLFHKQLRINFFNTRTQTIRSHTPELPTMPQFYVESPRVEFHPQPVKVRSAVQPRLLANGMNRNAYDDYSTYKANHPRTNTIN